MTTSNKFLWSTPKWRSMHCWYGCSVSFPLNCEFLCAMCVVWCDFIVWIVCHSFTIRFYSIIMNKCGNQVWQSVSAIIISWLINFVWNLCELDFYSLARQCRKACEHCAFSWLPQDNEHLDQLQCVFGASRQCLIYSGWVNFGWFASGATNSICENILFNICGA